MAVDIVHLAPSGRPQIIFDAKYKLAYDGAAYGNADFYQMHAYSTALRVDTAWLVYAGGGPSATHEVAGRGGRVATFPLDLGSTPAHCCVR